jgi:hypothetical protein
MKRIIWVAQNKKHRIIAIWYRGMQWDSNNLMSLKQWKYKYSYSAYITKHYIEV